MPLEGALSMRPPSAEDGGQAFRSSSRFCIYVLFLECYFHPQVSRPVCINVLVLTSKSHMRGVCHMLLVDPCQWKCPEESRVTLGGLAHRPNGRHMIATFYVSFVLVNMCGFVSYSAILYTQSMFV